MHILLKLNTIKVLSVLQCEEYSSHIDQQQKQNKNGSKVVVSIVCSSDGFTQNFVG